MLQCSYELKTGSKILGGIKMKVIVFSSKSLKIDNLEKYIPLETTEIVLRGKKGIDIHAREYALKNNIKLTEFSMLSKKYNIFRYLKKDYKLIDYSNYVIVFWDGKPNQIKKIIDYTSQINKQLKLVVPMLR